jgi:hypothetical protein
MLLFNMVLDVERVTIAYQICGKRLTCISTGDIQFHLQRRLDTTSDTVSAFNTVSTFNTVLAFNTVSTFNIVSTFYTVSTFNPVSTLNTVSASNTVLAADILVIPCPMDHRY